VVGGEGGQGGSVERVEEKVWGVNSIIGNEW